MRRRLAVSAIAAAIGLAAAVSCVRGDPPPSWGPSSAQLRSGVLHIDGRDRTFLFFTPPGEGPFPLLLALHGRGGDGASQEKLTGLSRIAAREKFLVVYPDGVDKSWHDARNVGPAAKAGVDDVAFLSKLVDEFVAHHGADANRVYVSGMSNGAMMSLTLACRLADKLAGVVAVTGLLPSAVECRPSKPISVALIVGDVDPLVPYGGGEVAKNRGAVLSAAASTELLRVADGCEIEESERLLPDADPADETRTSVRAFTHCRDGVEVRLYTVRGGGHTWPGGWQYLARGLIGQTSHDFSASEELWSFLSAHRR